MPMDMIAQGAFDEAVPGLAAGLYDGVVVGEDAV